MAKPITIEIPLFMLWESARPSCLTSDDWNAAFSALQDELTREIDESGSTRVYQMLEGCMARLTENDYLRKMTDKEVDADAPCPFYETLNALSTMERKNLVFTEAEANAAADDWNFNCGPAALCALLDLTPAQLRPHLIDFEQKGYTNPSLMFAVLNNLKIEFRKFYRSDLSAIPQLNPYPRFGLVRIQWGGPWTKEGVPMRVRYRQTHWVAVRGENSTREIFDVNAMGDGGWLPFRAWSENLIPWLIKECVPNADGTWWPTHGISITPGQTPTRRTQDSTG